MPYPELDASARDSEPPTVVNVWVVVASAVAALGAAYLGAMVQGQNARRLLKLQGQDAARVREEERAEADRVRREGYEREDRARFAHERRAAYVAFLHSLYEVMNARPEDADEGTRRAYLAMSELYLIAPESLQEVAWRFLHVALSRPANVEFNSTRREFTTAARADLVQAGAQSEE